MVREDEDGPENEPEDESPSIGVSDNIINFYIHGNLVYSFAMENGVKVSNVFFDLNNLNTDFLIKFDNDTTILFKFDNGVMTSQII